VGAEAGQRVRPESEGLEEVPVQVAMEAEVAEAAGAAGVVVLIEVGAPVTEAEREVEVRREDRARARIDSPDGRRRPFIRIDRADLEAGPFQEMEAVRADTDLFEQAGPEHRTRGQEQYGGETKRPE
jgi:hypothetical protein